MIKGLNTLLFAKLTSDTTDQTSGKAVYAAPTKLSGAIEIKPKLNQNSAELYADDTLQDADYSVSTVGLTLTVDDDNDEIFCELIGMKEDGSGGYDASVYDESQAIGLGYIEVKGQGKYRVKFYPNCKVKPFAPRLPMPNGWPRRSASSSTLADRAAACLPTPPVARC